MRKTQILDCTLRDGGHHTLWHFAPLLVKEYFSALHGAGVEYCELGYRRIVENPHHGPWASCYEENFKKLNIPQSLKLAVMIDLKDFIKKDKSLDFSSLLRLFSPKRQSCLTMVRVAAHYHHQQYISDLVGPLKELGYKVGVNLMRSGDTSFSTISKTCEALSKKSLSTIDILTFADSFGSLDERKTEKLISMGREVWPNKLGFHGHDNKQLALRNSLMALDKGCDFIDATVCGMGKGPGNTALEYLMIELIKKEGENYNHRFLRKLILNYFYPLKKQIGWGDHYLYYLAAEEGVHPDKVIPLLNSLNNMEKNNE